MDFIILQAFNGVSYGALLFLFASGLSLIFGVMRIINISHGSYYLLAGYVAFTLMQLVNSYLLGMLGASVVVGLVAVLMVRVFLRKLAGNDLGQLLITMGFALVFQDLALLIWGGDPSTINVPNFLNGPLVVGHFYFPRYRIFMVLVAIFIGFWLWFFQAKTRVGAIVRAAVDNEEMACAMGINVPVVSMSVYALGAILAAIGGVIGGGFLSIYPGLDFELLPYAFVVVILGGRGSLEGAMLGSLVVGLVDNFGKVLFPELSYFTLFAPMVLMLAIRPTGLFGKK